MHSLFARSLQCARLRSRTRRRRRTRHTNTRPRPRQRQHSARISPPSFFWLERLGASTYCATCIRCCDLYPLLRLSFFIVVVVVVIIIIFYFSLRWESGAPSSVERRKESAHCSHREYSKGKYTPREGYACLGIARASDVGYIPRSPTRQLGSHCTFPTQQFRPNSANLLIMSAAIAVAPSPAPHERPSFPSTETAPSDVAGSAKKSGLSRQSAQRTTLAAPSGPNSKSAGAAPQKNGEASSPRGELGNLSAAKSSPGS